MPALSPFLAAYAKFTRDDGWAIASHVALSTLTALFPFLIFLATLAGFIGREEIALSATGLIFDSWPPQIAHPLSREITAVLTQPHGGLLTVSAVLSIYFSSSGVEAMRVALNRAYDARDHRPWWLLRLEAIVFVIVGAASLLVIAFLLVLAPLVWSLVGRYAPELAHHLEILKPATRYGVSTLVLGAGLIGAHTVLPAGRPPLPAVAPGILLTLALWLLFGAGFGDYLLHFADNYIVTYAGLASIMMALVFLYALSAIFIFGAELNQTLRREG
jgi:membrane protein